MTTAPGPRATGAVLWGRALTVSLVTLLVGSAAHVEADGLLPGRAVLVTVVLLGALVAAPLLRRPASTLRVVVLLVAGQGLVHTVLAVTAGHRGDPAIVPARTAAPHVRPLGTAAGGSRRGSFHDVVYDAAPSGAAGGGGGGDGRLSVPAPLLHAVTDLLDHPLMALTHVLAAALVGWWLARGERALWELLVLAARAGARPVRAALLAVRAHALLVALRSLRSGARRAPDLPDPPPLFAELHARRVPRRGPPLAA